MVLSRGRWPRNSEPRRVGRTRLGVGGMRDGQIAVGPLAPRSHAFLTPSPVPPSSLFFSSPLSLPFFLFLAPYFSPTNAFIRVYASLSNPSVLRCTDQPRASTLSLSLVLYLPTCSILYLVSSRDQFLQQRFIAIPFLSLPLFSPSSSLFLSNCLVLSGKSETRNVPFYSSIYFRSRKFNQIRFVFVWRTWKKKDI